MLGYINRMDCKYCKKQLKSRSSLNHHQKTAKYCLEKQGLNSDKYTCPYCNKQFTNKHNYERHLEICTDKKVVDNIKIEEIKSQHKDEQIEDYKSRLEFLQDRYDNLQDQYADLAQNASQKTTTINNTATAGAISNSTADTRVATIAANLSPITKVDLKAASDNLTMEHIHAGGAGYARLAMAYVFKNKIKCTDYARFKFIYRMEDMEKAIQDPDMVYMGPVFFEAIWEKNEQLVEEYKDTKNKQSGYHIDSTEEQKASDPSEKFIYLQAAAKAEQTRRHVSNIANGKRENIIFSHFKKEIACQTFVTN